MKSYLNINLGFVLKNSHSISIIFKDWDNIITIHWLMAVDRPTET